MKTVTDLNTLIIEKAAYDLKKEIHESSDALRRKMSIGYSWKSGLFDGEGKPIDSWKVVEMIEEALFNLLLPHAQDEAVQQFLSKVESLQSQIDELAAIGSR